MKNIAIKGELMLVRPLAKLQQLLPDLFKGQAQPIDIYSWHSGSPSMQLTARIAFPADPGYSIDPVCFLSGLIKN